MSHARQTRMERMDMNSFNLFLKMLEEEYRLSTSELQVITRRMLADDIEFERVWKLYRNKSKSMKSGDSFKATLRELLS